ncbi:MAG: shikimate kinase [Candidatus Scalindua sp.]|nr:shikimate kinase [Candidatus Scalindua sp.]
MNIVLIGFRGTGKSTIGKLLANRLKRSFVDTDEYIINTTGKTIKEIFQEEGEKKFRQIEADTIALLRVMDKKIIAAGGGVVLNNKNVETLKSNGVLILLEAAPEIIHKRISLDEKTMHQRPSLTDKGAFEEIKHLIKQRQKLYDEAASHRINTSNKSTEEIVEEILFIIGNLKAEGNY